jgi:hypothetical protein
MNAVVQFDSTVPAFLRNANFLSVNQKAMQGLSTGAPPRLSYRGSRFRFVAADGTETPVTENNGVAIDVVVVDASEHVSKFFYNKAYDPNAEDMSPACFSDNGVGPSIRAAKPQSLLCGNCPNNAWGSKITPQGTQVKACSDVKKLAIIPVNNINGSAYMLTVPGASLKTWQGFVDTVSKRNIPVPALVVQVSFDVTAEYPKLVFTPTRYISEQEAGAIQELFGSEECDELVGRKDTPIQAMPAATGQHEKTAPIPQAAQNAASPPPAAVFTPPPAPPTPPFLGQQAAPATQPQAEQAAPRRRRRTNAEIAAANAAPVAQAAPTPAPAPVFAAATPAPAAPAAGPADLNALLDKVMAGK